ncbi:hypothetical protein AB3S75_048231 [Citrus x aurantiifolia]
MASSSSSSSSSSSEKKITLKSSDGEELNVEKNVALEFEPVTGFLEDNSVEADDEAIVVPLPNVSAAVLSELIPYVKQRLELSAKPVQEKLIIKAFDDQFTRHLSDDKLGELILAANYLGVNYLLDVLCDVTADRIKNKSVEYVREFLGIQNDFTPEEEAELRAQCPWAFEGVDQD